MGLTAMIIIMERDIKKLVHIKELDEDTEFELTEPEINSNKK